MITPADRPLRETPAALLRMLEGMDRREGSKLARRLVVRAIADERREPLACPAGPRV